MLPLKLRKIGNSVGVVFPKEALAKLHAEAGDTVFLSETPDGFRLTAHDPEFEKQMEIAEEGMKSYRNTLRVLAK
ncbi:MAG: AbrB/MazE/SpoVT family DNA-binding domain-containing protein [Pseudomonadota bacterium]